MKTFKLRSFILASVVTLSITLSFAKADDHYDIAPYLVDGKLQTGGLDHSGNAVDPNLSVYGFEFGEDAADPYNPSDPGVNQAAGVGNLPSGATLRYNILSSLLYWDGEGEVRFTQPPTSTIVTLLMGTNSRTLTADSGEQTGSLIQSVASDGSVHKHFTTSLWADAESSNVPGCTGYIAPENGIYAFSLELTMAYNGTTYTSDPFWLVFNNGMSEDVHGAAMESFVPEPMTLTLLAMGGMTMFRRRRI
jgi:hypothetical protein